MFKQWIFNLYEWFWFEWMDDRFDGRHFRTVWRIENAIQKRIARRSIAEGWIEQLHYWAHAHLSERLADTVSHIINFTNIGNLIYALSSPHGWTGVKCRWQGHPYDVYWYNAGGLEPDTHCMNCGEDLG